MGVLLGNGDGTFQSQVTYGVDVSPNSVAIADLNAEGRLDLATSNEGASDVSVLLAKSDLTFWPPLNFAGSYGFSSIAVGDVNNDGKPDLVVANDPTQMGMVGVLLGNGAGAFLVRRSFAVGPSGNSVAIGDLDGDGEARRRSCEPFGGPEHGGVAECWGYNFDGELGVGTTLDVLTPEQAPW